MRFFPWVDFQFWAIALFLGAVAAILTYIAWGSYPSRGKSPCEEEPEKKEGREITAGHAAGKNPIAPFLIFVYAVSIVWSLSYFVYVYFSDSRF